MIKADAKDKVVNLVGTRSDGSTVGCYVGVVNERRRRPIGLSINLNSNDSNIDLDSILIPSDELNFITNSNQKFKYIFSGLPLIDYSDHSYSKKVTDHLKKIILWKFRFLKRIFKK